MRKFDTTKCISIFMCILSLLSIYADIPDKNKSRLSVSKTTVPEGYQQSNIGNLTAWIRVDGLSSRAPDGATGSKYPKNTADIVYCDGIMWVADVNDTRDPNSLRLRAGGQTYRSGTVAGHIITPGNSTTPPVLSDPNTARVYRIRRDWQSLTIDHPELIADAASVFDVDPIAVTTSMQEQILADYEFSWNNWPTELGAPYYDNNANNVYDSGDEPGLENADQVIWLVVNDANAYDLYASPPIGLEIQITLWSYKSAAPIGQAQFKRYRIINKSGFEINDMHLGWWSDVDLGTYWDDFVGVNEDIQTAFVYNGRPIDTEFDNYNLPPSAAGYTLLQGPIVPSVGDTAIYDFRKIPDFKNLSISSFGFLAQEPPPPSLGTYEGTLEWYNWIRGYYPYSNIVNPIPYTTNSGQTTKFPLNGNPITSQGDIDGGYFTPWDRQFVMSLGKFNMVPLQTQEIILAVVGGNLGIGTKLTSLGALFDNVKAIRNNYENENIPYPSGIFTPTASTMNNSSGNLQVNLYYLPNVTSAVASFTPYMGNGDSLTLNLFDDGMHNDGAANDGIWGNNITTENKQYPYFASITVMSDSRTFEFSNAFNSIRFRPEPKLDDFDVIWENALQDGLINSDEKVHLGYDVINIDQVNSIDNLFIEYEFPSFFSQVVKYDSSISAGATINDPSKFIVQEAGIGVDSLNLSLIVNFDGHSVGKDVKLPISSWLAPQNWMDTLKVFSNKGTLKNTTAIIADPNLLTNHNYKITFEEDLTSPDSLVWNLFDVTEGVQKSSKQQLYNDGLFNHPIIDGVQFIVKKFQRGFSDFTVISNANGLLNPIQAGALSSAGFPTSGVGPNDDQQVAAGRWIIHTVDNDGNQSSYDNFLLRSQPRFGGWNQLATYDFELRFTSEGGYAEFFNMTPNTMQVPFELWNIGIETPDDPSDDFRMFPLIYDDDKNNMFNIPMPGTRIIGQDDHSVSSGDDDPYTDLILWYNPSTTTAMEVPGDSAYRKLESDIINGTFESLRPFDYFQEVLRLTVLVNLNGGSTFPYNQDLPETGTTFRIETTKPNFPGDELVLIAPANIVNNTIPTEFSLSQNYPNPFNPTTEIQFSLAKSEAIKLEIFNVLGQKIKTLVNERKQSGSYTVTWNGINENGIKVASGIYFYRISAGEFVKSRKMILIK